MAMASDWEKIEQIYQEALGLSPDQRAAFIQAATGGDEDLCREIESLLSYQPKAEKFLAGNALHSTAKGLVKEQIRSLVGRQIGVYKIVSLLGAGGMGEVYRAVDIRLNRTVAIKFLLSHLSARPDLRKRFEREARSISNLNHPHICTLYDIGQQEGLDFLVMEYLEGKTLAQQLKEGCLPPDQVLRYAIQIGDALAQAHKQGVIHRDLKPGNIMLTARGAKLLDFGLAKLEAEPQPSGLTSTVALAAEGKSLTAEGIILGTLEYMAPEQLEGKEVDARTDIFSFGTVIYEMATGRKAFTGDSKASVIVAILTAQPPPVTRFQPLVPPELEEVVRKCLMKEPAERWQSAAEVTSQLKQISEKAPFFSAPPPIPKTVKERSEGEAAIGSETLTIADPFVQQPRNVLSRLIRSQAWKLSFVGILLALVIGALVVWQVWRQPEKPKEISLRPLTSYSVENPLETAAIAPDGKYLAFCSKGKLFIQIIQSGDKRLVALPEGFYAAAVVWFPDGTRLLVSRSQEAWIQVKGQAIRLPDRSLWSLSILGGAPQKIVDHAEFPGGLSADGSSVSPDGSLVAFHRVNPERETVELWMVGANGEGPRRIRAPSQPNQGYFGPMWSSNGKRLFYIRDFDSARSIESCDLRGEQVTNIFPSKNGQKYFHGWEALHSLCWAPDGRILFSMQETGPFNIWEIKVDAVTGRPLSEARRLTQWVGFQTVHADSLSITADGKQLVVVRANLQGDVYVAEAENGGKSMRNPRRLTLDETDDLIWGWTPDSRSVLFSSGRNRDNLDIFKQDITQTDAEAIVATPESEWHPNVSPDGAFILYLVSVKTNPLPWDSSIEARLMRVPVGGGPPESVLSGKKISNFSCASKAKLCVVAEEMEGKQILTTFDPLKGRGEKLPTSDYPQFGRGILSPQGRLIEKMTSSPDGLYIRVRSLTTGSTEEHTFKNLTGVYQFVGWSLDGRGIYLYTGGPLRGTSVYAGLNGETHVLWKRGSGPGFWFDYAVPSPDGRYLAFTLGTYESNAWMLENF
jgi:serine/threonine protein kinase/Tol biopolymer transport system component